MSSTRQRWPAGIAGSYQWSGFPRSIPSTTQRRNDDLQGASVRATLQHAPSLVALNRSTTVPPLRNVTEPPPISTCVEDTRAGAGRLHPPLQSHSTSQVPVGAVPGARIPSSKNRHAPAGVSIASFPTSPCDASSEHAAKETKRRASNRGTPRIGHPWCPRFGQGSTPGHDGSSATAPPLRCRPDEEPSMHTVREPRASDDSAGNSARATR